MILVRNAADRGFVDHGWLQARHTFSFAGYRDPDFMGFRSLRVMNEDRVAPGRGFGAHPHRDMEIVTYVLQGALEHKDSMGHGEILHAGEFQRMSAGKGITHSEFNPSGEEQTHLYQIWLLPNQKGVDPSYQQRRFDVCESRDQFHLVASPDGEADSLTIGTDARIYLSNLEGDGHACHDLPNGRHGWLQVLRGEVRLNDDLELATGDGVAISDEPAIRVNATSDAELMLFDLA